MANKNNPKNRSSLWFLPLWGSIKVGSCNGKAEAEAKAKAEAEATKNAEKNKEEELLSQIRDLLAQQITYKN